MKNIVKGVQPEELRRWKEVNSNVPENLAFGNLQADVKVPVREQMLNEQGFLCAYTMIRIATVEECHIEHIIPQRQEPRSNQRDLDYENMLACFPGEHKPDGPQQYWSRKQPYGAIFKDGKEVNDYNFVSPLQHDVEKRFIYDDFGGVSAMLEDEAAWSTIRILKLDHSILNDLRKAAVNEVLQDVSSAEQARERAMLMMMCDWEGRLPEFCLVLSQSLNRLAEKMN
jgi:uncharacterized protein (TIGR02646 family)